MTTMNYQSPEAKRRRSTGTLALVRARSNRAGDTPSRRTKPTAELEQLKRHLLEQQLDRVADEQEKVWLVRAAEDAASVAWSTAYPLLVLPALLEEKARQARDQFNRQLEISSRSQSVLALAE